MWQKRSGRRGVQLGPARRFLRDSLLVSAGSRRAPSLGSQAAQHFPGSADAQVVVGVFLNPGLGILGAADMALRQVNDEVGGYIPAHGCYPAAGVFAGKQLAHPAGEDGVAVVEDGLSGYAGDLRDLLRLVVAEGDEAHDEQAAAGPVGLFFRPGLLDFIHHFRGEGREFPCHGVEGTAVGGTRWGGGRAG